MINVSEMTDMEFEMTLLKAAVLSSQEELGVPYKDMVDFKIKKVRNIHTNKDVELYIEVKFCGCCKYFGTSRKYARAKKVAQEIIDEFCGKVIFLDINLDNE